MRRLILSLATSFLFLFTIFAFVVPGDAQAKPDKPKGLRATTSCIQGNSYVNFSWDTFGYSHPYNDATWDLVINDGPKIRVSEVGSPTNPIPPYIYSARSDSAGTTYNWYINNGEKGCFGDCENRSDVETVVRKTCSNDPQYNPLPDNPPPSTSDTCQITYDSSGNLTKVDGNCTVCAWDSANEGSCNATDAGFNQWSNLTACGEDSLYENDPNVCNNLNNKSDCEEAVGQCKINPHIPPETRGYKIIQQECKPCTKINIRGVVDKSCNFDSKPACQVFLESSIDQLWKCVDGEVKKCGPNAVEGVNGCGLGDDIRSTCENLGVTPTTEPTNAPLSRPCGNRDWTNSGGCERIQTAIGPVSTDANVFVKWVLGFVLGISGGILLIILIINGYKLMISQGDPEKTKESREAIVSAIAGLLLIIFSIVLLRLVTVNVLQLPGFG